MEQNESIPKQLAKLAAGRDFIVTDEIAAATNHKPQTVRKTHCQTGEYFGIRPVKLGNRLLWPVADVAKLLNGEHQKSKKALRVGV